MTFEVVVAFVVGLVVAVLWRRVRTSFTPSPLSSAAAAPADSTTPTLRLQQLSDPVTTIAESSAHPRDLMDNATFREAVEIFNSDRVPLKLVTDYVGGANWPLATAACAALSSRADRAEAMTSVVAGFRHCRPWPMYYLLRYFGTLEVRPPIGALALQCQEWWVDHPFIPGLLSEHFGQVLPAIATGRENDDRAPAVSAVDGRGNEWTRARGRRTGRHSSRRGGRGRSAGDGDAPRPSLSEHRSDAWCGHRSAQALGPACTGPGCGARAAQRRARDDVAAHRDATAGPGRPRSCGPRRAAPLLQHACHRPGRSRRCRRRSGCDVEGRADRCEQTRRRVSVRRADGNREDRARQDAGGIPVRVSRSAHPPGYERVPERRIDSQDRRRPGSPGRVERPDRSRAQAAVLGRAPRRVREGAPTPGICFCRCSTMGGCPMPRDTRSTSATASSS